MPAISLSSIIMKCKLIFQLNFSIKRHSDEKPSDIKDKNRITVVLQDKPELNGVYNDAYVKANH